MSGGIVTYYVRNDHPYLKIIMPFIMPLASGDAPVGRAGKGAPMKKISVIIPMYNAENYIRQCLRSVADQTYRDVEMLVVDDGSVDKGAAICGELAEADGRIRMLRQENQGVSAARNRGIEAAAGEYVFFLDSDDAIPPFLLEEMLRQAEENHAQLAFCGYRKLDSGQLDAVLREAARAPGNHLPQAEWLRADQAGTAEWFHVKYTDILSGIGGKLILREAIGDLRFDRGLTNGEDTWFLYQLVRGQVRSVYCPAEWYYYREHPESVTNSAGTAREMRYFACARRIRDSEYESGHTEHAMRWEILAVDQIRRSWAARKSKDAAKDGKVRRELRKTAAAERRHPLFRRICFSDRVLFACCFTCYPIYAILNQIALILVNKRSR